MSSLDQQDLFGSGPHSIRCGSWRRSLRQRGFPGLDGELVLDMGLRGRQIHQAGRLEADSFEAMNTMIDQLDRLVDGALHSLTDNHGRTFPQVLIEKFEPTTPVRRGRRFWCEYTVRYRQLP